MGAKIFQKRVNSTDGDCVQACLATLFGLPYDEVPTIDPKKWREPFYEFLKARGVFWVNVPTPTNKDLIRWQRNNRHLSGQCTLAVRSFALEDALHCVVGAVINGVITVTHDPNRDNADRCSDEYEILEIDILIPATTEAQ